MARPLNASNIFYVGFFLGLRILVFERISRIYEVYFVLSEVTYLLDKSYSKNGIDWSKFSRCSLSFEISANKDILISLLNLLNKPTIFSQLFLSITNYDIWGILEICSSLLLSNILMKEFISFNLFRNRSILSYLAVPLT